MSKVTLGASIVAVGLAMWCAAPVMAQESRIVFIDMDRVFTEFHKTQQADAQLKEQAEEFNTERTRMLTELEGMNEKFLAAREQAQDTALSEDRRNRNRSEAEELLVDIRDFEARIQRFDQTRRKQLEDQGRRMRTRIVSEIQEEIRRYARAQGYQAVIDSSGQSLNAVEVVLFLDSRLEITDAIIDVLNRGN